MLLEFLGQLKLALFGLTHECFLMARFQQKGLLTTRAYRDCGGPTPRNFLVRITSASPFTSYTDTMSSLRIFVVCLMLTGPAAGQTLTMPAIPFNGFVAHVMAHLSRRLSLGVSLGLLTTRRMSNGASGSGLLLCAVADGMPMDPALSTLFGVQLVGRF